MPELPPPPAPAGAALHRRLPRHSPGLILAPLAAITLLLAAACTSTDGATLAPEAPAPTTEAAATASPTSTEAPATATADTTRTAPRAIGVDSPEVDRVLAHLDELAATIGSRPAGSEEERQAATYIAGVLEAAGYDTTIEPFQVTTRVDGSTLSVETAGGEEIAVRPFMMNGSAAAEAAGAMVYGGLGGPEDLAGLNVEGHVLLLDRGILSFGEKTRNAELAGAVAVVIANNEAGPYGGNLGSRSATIPVVSISREEGELLRPLAGTDASVTVRAAIDRVEAESRNVVGRSGDVCRFYIGAHYDSVPAGPGANDNASGTALMLELARTHRTEGLCVIAFGAEEIGLFGSQDYVATNDLSDARFMLNFDMAGRLDDALIIGDAALTDVLVTSLEGLPIRAGQFPPFASSDHATFLNAGVPAVTITSGDDPQIHTSRDDINNVSRASLATMLEIATISLNTALTGAG